MYSEAGSCRARIGVTSTDYCYTIFCYWCHHVVRVIRMSKIVSFVRRTSPKFARLHVCSFTTLSYSETSVSSKFEILNQRRAPCLLLDRERVSLTRRETLGSQQPNSSTPKGEIGVLAATNIAEDQYYMQKWRRYL
jgi:hypothetical protein